MITILGLIFLSFGHSVEAGISHNSADMKLKNTQLIESFQVAKFKKEVNRTKDGSKKKRVGRKDKTDRNKAVNRKKSTKRKKDISRARNKRNDAGGIIDDDTQRVREEGKRSFNPRKYFGNGIRSDVKRYHNKNRSTESFRKK